MMYELFDLFTENFESSDVQVTVMSRLNNQMIQVIFRGDPDQVRQWFTEVRGEVVYMEVRKLYDTLTVMTFGVPHNGEIYKIERNTIDLEIEHLSYN